MDLTEVNGRPDRYWCLIIDFVKIDCPLSSMASDAGIKFNFTINYIANVFKIEDWIQKVFSFFRKKKRHQSTMRKRSLKLILIWNRNDFTHYPVIAKLFPSKSSLKTKKLQELILTETKRRCWQRGSQKNSLFHGFQLQYS